MHSRPRSVVTLAATFGLALLAARAPAQLPLDTQLLVNGDFETGDLTGWTAATSQTLIAEPYGSGGTPSFAVSTAIGGGLYHANDFSGGGARIEQTFDLTQNSGPLEVFARGHFGSIGTDGDRARLEVRLVDGTGMILDEFTIGDFGRDQRNDESVLLIAEDKREVPMGATAAEVRLQMVYLGGNNADGAADNLYFELRRPTTTPRLPLNSELLTNPDFENGWSTESPLDLNEPNTWLGTNSSTVRSEPWGGSTVPAFDVGRAVNGGLFCVGDFSRGGAILRQQFDLQGYEVEIANGQLAVRLGGHFGGLERDSDRAQLDVRFINAVGGQIDIVTVGNFSRENRNLESVVLRGENLAIVPAGTVLMRVDLRMTYFGGNNADGVADNLSVKLENAQGTAPQPVDVNLLVGADFENTWSTTSPLQLNDPRSWRGVASDRAMSLEPWGGRLPSSLGSSIGGGRWFLEDNFNGNAVLRQTIDLSGNDTAIRNGTLGVTIAGYFGGYATGGDRSRLRATFRNTFGGTIGTITTTDISVGLAQLNRQSVATIVPPTTVEMQIDLEMRYFNSGAAEGAADNLSATLFDASIPAIPAGYGQNLLADPGFESEAVGLIAPGWTLAQGYAVATAYEANTSVPTAAEAAAWGGGGFVLDTRANTTRITQRIDLRGNATEITSDVVDLKLEGWLGGTGSSPDSARIEVTYFDDSIPPFALRTDTVGPVSNGDRGNVTTLLNRKGTFDIPTVTSEILVSVVLVDNGGGGADQAMADNISAVLVNVMDVPTYPGTGEDLSLLSAINAATLSGGPGADIKDVQAGDILRLRLISPNGSFDYSPLLVLASVFNTGQPPVPILPGIVVDLGQVITLVTGTGALGVPFPILAPGGVDFAWVMPSSLPATTSLIIQGFALPSGAPAPFMPMPATNGIYVGTDGHEFRF